MSPSEADAARKKAEEAVAKATEMTKAAKMAKAEADAAKKAAEGARMNEARVAEEKAAMALAEKGMARRLAAKEAAAKTKVSEAKAAWERARDEMRNFKPIEAAIRPAVYRAVSASESARNAAGFPDREDSLDNLERAIELISNEEIDPMAERDSSWPKWREAKPNPWKDLTQNERIAWNVVRKKMGGYTKARVALGSAVATAYRAAAGAAIAELMRLCEATQVDMYWYDDSHVDSNIRCMVRWCLAATAMPDAGEIVRQIRSSIGVLKGLDAFFEAYAVVNLLRYERGQMANAVMGLIRSSYGHGLADIDDLTEEPELSFSGVPLPASHVVDVGGLNLHFGNTTVHSSTVRHFHNTIRRLKEISDGLEAARGATVN